MREIVLRSSFELKNKPLPLILDYDWCNANQDELCISDRLLCISFSLDTYLAPLVFILHWTHPKNVVKNFYRNKIK